MSKLGLPTDGGPDGVTVLKQGFNVDPLLQKQAACISTMTYNEYWQVIDAGLKPEDLTVFKYEDQGVATLEDGLYVLEDKLNDPAFVETMAKFVRASMKGWKWAEENPDDAAMIVLDNDETGAQTEAHQKRMMGEIAKLTAGSRRRARPGRLRADGADAAVGGVGAGDHQGARGRLDPRRHRQGRSAADDRRAPGAGAGPGVPRPEGRGWPGPRRSLSGSVPGTADDPGGGCTTRSSPALRRGSSAAARGRRPSSGSDLPGRAAPDLDPRPAGLLRARRGDHRRADGFGGSNRSGPASARGRSVADIGDVPAPAATTSPRVSRENPGPNRRDRRPGCPATLHRRRPFHHLPDPEGRAGRPPNFGRLRARGTRLDGGLQPSAGKERHELILRDQRPRELVRAAGSLQDRARSCGTWSGSLS